MKGEVAVWVPTDIAERVGMVGEGGDGGKVGDGEMAGPPPTCREGRRIAS